VRAARRLSLAAAGLAVALAAGACTHGPAHRDEPDFHDTAPAPAPDTPVSHEVPPSAADPGPRQPTLVVPRGGMAGVRPHAFEAAAPSADGRTLRVTFWGGVAPCFVLDRVGLREAPNAVTVTLYAGSDPTSPDVACIEIALYMAVDVMLSSPLAARRIIDGADALTKGSDPGLY
jgi:hypothetical protein